MRGYCAAVRSALTDDGRPPVAASGLKLHGRLGQIAASLDRIAAARGGLGGGLKRLRQLLAQGLAQTAALWPGVRLAYRWVKRVARLLANESGRSGRQLRRQFAQLLSRMRQAATTAAAPVAGPLRHFVKVNKSYWPGLFA